MGGLLLPYSLLNSSKGRALKDVIVRAVENDEELRQANELMARAHGQNPAESFAWLTSFGVGYPGFRREHTRVALFGSQVVAALRLTTDTIRIGEARLKMGGVGWVTTDGAWSRKGIVSRVMTDTLRCMQEQRYHVSMTFGISEFYRRWGFAAALSEHITTVDLTTFPLNGQGQPFKVRPAKPGDIQAMQKIHASNDLDTACSLIRTQAHLANKWKQWEAVRVLTDARGKLAAYFRGARSNAGYFVDEVGAADHDACMGVLHVIARLAREAGTEQLVFAAPPNHPLIRYVSRHIPRDDTAPTGNGNGMMAFVNLGEALESMIPEWESRLLQTSLAHSHAEVSLLVGRSAWRVRAHHGAVDVSPGSGGNKVVLSAQELVQLTAGCRELQEVLAAKRRIINAEGVALLHSMFPTRVPYVWMQDRF